MELINWLITSWQIRWSNYSLDPSKTTPWKINMEPKNHLFEKENHLPNLHYYVPC